MPAESNRFLYLIICDDVRQETNGKEILIGVYNSIMLFRSFPAHMQKMFFRIVVKPSHEKAENFSFSIIPEEGEPLVTFSMPVSPDQRPESDLIFNLALQNIHFSAAGKYKIMFGLDEPPRHVWSFSTRQATTPEEIQQLGDNIV